MILIFSLGALCASLFSVIVGEPGALLVAFVAAVALVAMCVHALIVVRDPYKLGGIPTGRVIREGWRRRSW